MGTDGLDVSRYHGLMVCAICATRRQTGTDERRPNPFAAQEDGMGGQEMADYGVCNGMRRGGGGRRLIDTILYARCSTD